MKLNSFWMIWNESHGIPTYKHDSLESAKLEAERLAHMKPGETFKILQFIAECKKTSVVWHFTSEDITPEDVPF